MGAGEWSQWLNHFNFFIWPLKESPPVTGQRTRRKKQGHPCLRAQNWPCSRRLGWVTVCVSARGQVIPFVIETTCAHIDMRMSGKYETLIGWGTLATSASEPIKVYSDTSYHTHTHRPGTTLQGRNTSDYSTLCPFTGGGNEMNEEHREKHRKLIWLEWGSEFKNVSKDKRSRIVAATATKKSESCEKNWDSQIHSVKIVSCCCCCSDSAHKKKKTIPASKNITWIINNRPVVLFNKLNSALIKMHDCKRTKNFFIKYSIGKRITLCSGISGDTVAGHRLLQSWNETIYQQSDHSAAVGDRRLDTTTRQTPANEKS